MDDTRRVFWGKGVSVKVPTPGLLQTLPLAPKAYCARYSAIGRRTQGNDGKSGNRSTQNCRLNTGLGILGPDQQNGA